MELNIDLSSLMTPNFTVITPDILQGKYDRVVLQGGRGSLKSTDCQYWLVLRTFILKRPAVEIIKIQDKINGILLNACINAIKRLGLADYFEYTTRPARVYMLDKPNGKRNDVTIDFVAPGNNAGKLRSGESKAGNGYATVFIEELQNFYNARELDTLLDTFSRSSDTVVLMAYNPPMRNSSWLNKKYKRNIGKALGYKKDSCVEIFEYKELDKVRTIKTLIHFSSYLDVVNDGKGDWIRQLIGPAEQKKIENNDYYRWNYLGEVLPTEATIFKNLIDWDGDTSKLRYKFLKMGLDCSHGGKDPWHFVNCTYDKINERLYILDEVVVLAEAKDLESVRDAILTINKHNQEITIDGSVPLFSRMLNNIGLVTTKAKKGPFSILPGIMWLKSLNGIYINSKRTPIIYRQMKDYEWVTDKDDEVTNTLPDINNHGIDALRYAVEDDIIYN